MPRGRFQFPRVATLSPGKWLRRRAELPRRAAKKSATFYFSTYVVPLRIGINVLGIFAAKIREKNVRYDFIFLLPFISSLAAARLGKGNQQQQQKKKKSK